jgi:alpha-tubulin suppressor-like RCC1 family protein
MNKSPKSIFVSVFIAVVLIGMSISAIPTNQNKELGDKENKSFTHTNVSFEGYQEDSIYSYSTLSSGGWTQCAITEDTRVVCWGNNAQGKRGLGGGIGNASETPPGKAGPWVVGNLSGGMVEVSAGAWSTCSLDQNGEIWCWGGGEQGQLGTGTDVCVDNTITTCNSATNYPPAKISLPLGKTAVSLSDANQGHFCAILDTGEGLCWGWNNDGQLGDGTVCTGGTWWDSNTNNPTPAGCNSNNGRYTPVLVDDSNFPANYSIISISTGMGHSCAIIDNNDLYCWGTNFWGQLGLGSSGSNDFPTPQYVDSGVIAVATGNEHSCALYENQIVKCWGNNAQGQLGTGNLLNQNAPTSINLSSNLALISLETAYNLNCAISEENIPYCWGANQWGQLGNYDPNDSRQETPLTVEDNLSVIAISLNGDTVCGIKTDSNTTAHGHRDVFCRGQSYKGQMGDGFWNQSWEDYNENNINLTSDYIGPQIYQGLGGIHIPERDIDSDSIIAILDNLPHGCPDGSYDPNYDGSCVTTDIGHYSTNQLYHSQIPCDFGTYQPNTGQASCIESSPGFFVDTMGSHTQQNCPSGTYQPNTGQASCIDALPGYSPNVNSTDQVICSSGYFQPNAGQEFCIPTSPGFYVSNLGSLNQFGCEPGTYQPNYASSSCIEASLGYFVENSNSTNQEICISGTYQPSYSSTSCLDSEPGYYVENDGSNIQTPCGLGTFSTSVGATGIETCILADSGHYVDSIGASSQSECPAGSYNSNIGSTSSDDCLFADAGNIVVNPGSSTQTPCEVGFYQPSTGQIFCLESSIGHYVSDTGATSSEGCIEGTYQPEMGQSECIDAAEGNFVSSPRASSQTPCSSGTYQAETGMTSCVLSDVGWHVPSEGQSMQIICPAGQYQPQPASSECILASPGTYSSSGATSVSPCLPGSYQSEAGQSGCVLADQGYFSSDISSTAQVACAEGTFQSLTGQESCQSADRGHYVDTSAATEQTPCYPGSYQSLMGSNICVLASEGYFVSNAGMSSQTMCPDGESQPNMGQTECILDSVDSGISSMVIIAGIGGVLLVGAAVLMRPKSKQKPSKGAKKVRKKKKQ